MYPLLTVLELIKLLNGRFDIHGELNRTYMKGDFYKSLIFDSKIMSKDPILGQGLRKNLWVSLFLCLV